MWTPRRCLENPARRRESTGNQEAPGPEIPAALRFVGKHKTATDPTVALGLAGRAQLARRPAPGWDPGDPAGIGWRRRKIPGVAHIDDRGTGGVRTLDKVQ